MVSLAACILGPTYQKVVATPLIYFFGPPREAAPPPHGGGVIESEGEP